MAIDKIFDLLRNRDIKTFQSKVVEHTLEVKEEIIALKAQRANINPQEPTTGLTILHLICLNLLNNSLLHYFEAHHIVNHPKYLLLNTAAQKENIVVLRWLLEKGQDINIQNDIGNTPLHAAVEYGKFEAVKFLLEYGADVTIQNERNETAIWQVFIPVDNTISDEIRIKTLDLLLQYGSNANSLDYNDTRLIRQAELTPFQHKTSKEKSLLLLLGIKGLNIPLSALRRLDLLANEANVKQLFSVAGYEKHKIMAGYNLYKAIQPYLKDKNQQFSDIAEHILKLTRSQIENIKPIPINAIKKFNSASLKYNKWKCELLSDLRLEDIDSFSPFYNDLTFLSNIDKTKDAILKRISEVHEKRHIHNIKTRDATSDYDCAEIILKQDKKGNSGKRLQLLDSDQDHKHKKLSQYLQYDNTKVSDVASSSDHLDTLDTNSAALYLLSLSGSDKYITDNFS